MTASNVTRVYDALVNAFPAVERKGKTMPYTSVNTYMFSFVGKEGNIALRLSPDDMQECIQQYGATVMMQHGRVMKDFICVSDDMMAEMNILKKYFQRSLDHTNTLKPKKK